MLRNSAAARLLAPSPKSSLLSSQIHHGAAAPTLARSIACAASSSVPSTATLTFFQDAASGTALVGSPSTSRVAHCLRGVRSKPALPRAFSTHSVLRSSSSSSTPAAQKPQQELRKDEEDEADREDEEEERKARKGSLRDRLRYLTRRYGWWALGVYLAASSVDLGLTFAAIHMLGADHIRQLETKVRDAVGLSKREESEEEKAQREQQDQSASSTTTTSSKNGSGNSAIWTELVLAYTIHKTLLLPVRVAFTAAVTPSFVKWLVKMRWAKSAAAVKQAAKQAAIKKAARKAAASS